MHKKATSKLASIILLFTAIFIVLGFSPIKQIFAAPSDEERAALEQQLKDLESEISEHEATIATLKTQGKSLESEISRLNAKVSKLNLQIKAVNVQLQQLDNEIEKTESEIEVTEGKIDFNKSALSHTLQILYEQSNQSFVEALIYNPTLTGFIGSMNDLISVQDNLSVVIDKITSLKNKLEDDKEVLSLKRSDAQALKSYQDSQKKTIEVTKKEQANLLAVTKGKESQFQKIVAERKKTAAQIRSQIFQLLGGGELSFEQAYDFAKLAGGATGVRPALIMAVLDRESALGRNVGRCSYKTAMHPTRDIPTFLEITAKLGINPDSIYVSCANSDGVYGGAMGPAQFIPSTWKLYEAEIATITGSNPPSPWNNAHAFVATGLYISDALNSSACVNYAVQNSHLVDKQTLQERCAAAKYYAGGRWYTYRFAYGDPVVERANEFQQDIDILNS
ncbi:MAG: hypothetical protein COU07_04045 [Candidatus Harrisonbacteria bacterium CG10_big_fil_rev_8_21_14_0_10_40_38]|uniref:Transglycosylase SLT domain-containing protein n=1 Tax=Candidatus Harrisonbacteria bacterium CG10_big_fil_rev_8_21_14_0_10_40_38 TaxID=1974583 RepID=A0A2H0UR68_9BACT|nr:MAG: hypothetical protein COU07_04045 [Candidatus Harrisonbacteria bacterium CG10_big_fil_rev_8_21_14_0_10_40_38]